MKPALILACACLVYASHSSPAQDSPCATTLPITTYRVDPVSNVFVSIAGSPLAVPIAWSGADDGTFTLPLAGFPFAFYGMPKFTLFLCTNGHANFMALSGAYTNKHPDDEAVPNDAIFPWCDDLHLGPLGSGWYWFDLTPGFERLIIEWNSVAIYPPAAPQVPFSFQLILYATTHVVQPDTFEFHYDRSSSPGLPLCANTLTATVSATVGCEPYPMGLMPSIGGQEGVDLGAANEHFPIRDLRFSPVFATLPIHSAGFAIAPQEPYCSIVPLVGTMAVPASCTPAQLCTDNDNSAATMNGAIPLPWKLNLDGRIVSSANMSSNGFLGLGQGNFSTSSANVALPALAEADLILAPFWDDLEGTGPGSGMFYRVDGAAGARVMTFEWAHMSRKGGATGDCLGAGGDISFQVRLFEGEAGALATSTPLCWYDTTLIGYGSDRIEYHYDHATFVPAPPATPFSATIGYENHVGALGAALPASPAIGAPPEFFPGFGGKVVIDACDFGQVRYFGDRNFVEPAGSGLGCLPEIKTNGIAPNLGNPFAIEMIGGRPDAMGVLMIDTGPMIFGGLLPVPRGGFSAPGIGTVWVNPMFATFVPDGAPLGISFPGVCDRSSVIELLIPVNPLLLGAAVWMQWIELYVSPAAIIGTNLSEGAKAVIGG